ncbi:MAG: DNA polymerase III subunit delta', partial [Propionibacteriaceae bacterium]
DRALGFGTKGAKPKNTAGAKKDLEQQQKARRTRLERDAIDRVLVELTAYYRDVIALQTQAAPELINSDYHSALSETAYRSTAEQTIRRIDAIIACRAALAANVAQLLAVESMMISLGRGV